ncbi:MAG: hypothetical protein HYX27_06690 [Acidobacteria bacterium]|nr:hypothetical protein [Acidobacteriota bacterium]
MRRRDLAWALLAGAAPAPAVPAQTPSAKTTASEDLAAAKERVKGNGAELAKFTVPIATEPAFAFKA